MATTAPLTIFPASTMPRKSSMKKSTQQKAPGGLTKGVALQLNTGVGPKGHAQIFPANESIKHSLFCEPGSSQLLHSNQGSLKRHLRTKRRSAALDDTAASRRQSSYEIYTPIEQDELAPLPENTHFGSFASNKRHSAISQFRRAQPPGDILIDIVPDDATLVASETDQLSPLPNRQHFNATPASLAEYPSPQSYRSGSPTLVRSNSGATGYRAPSPCPAYVPPTRSIFPQYDPKKPMDRQSYYPTATTPASTLSPAQVSKFGSPLEQPTLQRFDSGVAISDPYGGIPTATTYDLQALWRASSGLYPVSGRKFQFGIYQPLNRGTSLSIGAAFDEAFWTMDSIASAGDHKPAQKLKQLTIKKHNPQEAAPTPVAELVLPTSRPGRAEKDSQVSTIFPQAAALDAIEAVANSPEAGMIAEWDPNAVSREAARLAQDAVAEAYSRYRCELIRTTRRRDSVGAVTASYKLNHPMLGDLPITVTRAESQTSSQYGPKAKITIHHPSATSAAIAADTLALATLDFSRAACVIDTPAFLALDDPYVIDTALCALLAVAVIENDSIVTESCTFEPPPTKALATKKSKSSLLKTDAKAGGRKWYKPFSKRKVVEMAPVDEQGKVERNAEALVEVGINTAAFLIETGFRAARGYAREGREGREEGRG